MIIDPDFADHPKTVKLCRLLGPDAVRLLLRLWAHCQNRRTDQLPADPEDIAAICRFDGPAEQLVTALERCGWIDSCQQAAQLASQLPAHVAGWIAHGWKERNASWLAKIEGGKKRAKEARRSESGKMQAELAGLHTASPSAGSYDSSHPPAARQLAGLNGGAAAGSVECSGVENTPPIVPQGGLGEGAGATSKSNHSPTTCPDSDGKKDAAGVLEETKKKIGALFGRQSLFFGGDAERALADLERAGVLPLPESDWVLLEWWFGVPKDERDSDLRARRQTAETLACNLLAEIDRARGYAKKSGAVSTVKKNGPAVDLERLHAWFAPQWPDKPLPRSIEDLPEYLRDEARRVCNSQPITT